MTKDERWEQALSDIFLLSFYSFTGSIRFSMKNGAVSFETLKTLRRYASQAEAEDDVDLAQPQELSWQQR